MKIPEVPTIAISSSSNSPGITLTLESTGILLGILVSASLLGTMAVQLITKMNRISSSIAQIEEVMKEHARDAEKIRQIEKTLDLHIQEYVNRKDVIQMVLGQLDQKINHKFKRLNIREYEENTQEE
ncbi:hypothetical protein A6V25_17745 [Nostoc sp. ATCC 53789]|uniref:hypothetical protein n=1 Tax=Nostoc sp. ATCC 53789 TaxID=76335 RepID=UPI000DEC873F|nr:hypothetical protein [Nostoc sp. ATCC 53789]RCJ27743.1 hypothetical protein A6V25_17745 [Nostoc sp. ATCC 53789]